MATNAVTGTVNAGFSLLNTLGTVGSNSKTSENAIVPDSSSLTISAGTGALQANELYYNSVATSTTPTDLDLTSLTDANSRTCSFSAVKGLVIQNTSTTNGENILIGNRTIAAPASAPTVAVVSGGSCTAGTYLVSYTWVNANGETTRSPDATATTASSNLTINVTIPSLPTGVTSANVYISTAGGASSTETRQNIVPQTAGTYAQTTAPAAGSAYPSTNTCSYLSFAGPLASSSDTITVYANSSSPVIWLKADASGWACGTNKYLRLTSATGTPTARVAIVGLG